MKTIYFGVVMVLALGSQPALAKICDFKPSKLIGTAGSAAVAAASGAIAGAGGAAKAAGLYTLVHATSGAAMLGSTAGGTSAAGTVGIMGGTAGAGAAAMALVLNPVVLGTAAVTAAGVGAFEGGCHLAGK